MFSVLLFCFLITEPWLLVGLVCFVHTATTSQFFIKTMWKPMCVSVPLLRVCWFSGCWWASGLPACRESTLLCSSLSAWIPSSYCGTPFWTLRVRRQSTEGACYKKTWRSFTGAIIGPFSTGADQSRPFNSESSGATTGSCRLAKVDVQKERKTCVCEV